MLHLARLVLRLRLFPSTAAVPRVNAVPLTIDLSALGFWVLGSAQARKEKLAQRTQKLRQVEIAHQIRPHGYKDIISWEADRLHAKNPRKPIRPNKPMLVQNTKGRVERMTKETAAEMRSSKNRFVENKQKSVLTHSRRESTHIHTIHQTVTT